MRPIQYFILRVSCIILCVVLSLSLTAQNGNSENCENTVNLTIFSVESRCKATGVITIFASGGSGQYNYRVRGPVNTPFTSSIVISGLMAGNYDVEVRDLGLNCIKVQRNVVVPGTYVDPRFSLLTTNVTCKNASNGSVAVTGLTGGRSPYTFTITAAPVPALVGTSNSTGTFNNLPAGDYSIHMGDSCSGIQTRRATILPYDWWIEASGGSKTGCGTAELFLNLKDNRGRQTPDSIFTGFQYGWVRGAADTVWNINDTFTANIDNRRSVMLVARDGCGNTASVPWAVNPKPAVSAAVQTTLTGCNEFTASITDVTNLTTPKFTLVNGSNAGIDSNATGTFTGLPGGAYTIRVRDICYDTTINIPFTVEQLVPNITGPINMTRVTCNTFNATVTGLVNFTNPEICLYQGSTRLMCNSSGAFLGVTNGTYTIRIKDGCYDTTIISPLEVLPLVPSVSPTVAMTNHLCSTFDAAVTGQTNLSNPKYILINDIGARIDSNFNGTFGSIPYGSYCINVKNDPACYDTTIVVCFTGRPIPPSVGESLSIDRKCDSIDLWVNSQSQLFNALYCIYDSNNVLIRCNSSGIFKDLRYGSYCISIKNDPACYDTTIMRCIKVTKLIPELGNVSIVDAGCLGFTGAITGAANLNDPVYTLISNSGERLDSNTTGVFTNLAFGRYCMEMRNNPRCYDTTIVRCFTGEKPKPDGGVIMATNVTCPGFTATVTGLLNFNNPFYVLKNNAGTVVQSNPTGVFTILGYQSYTIDVINDPLCYDTTITLSINPTKPTPSVGGVVTDSLTCTGFNVAVTGQTLLTNPIYNILNGSNAVVFSNTTGSFSDIPYASYTMQIVDGCYETPFLFPFSATRVPLEVTAAASVSCKMGSSNITASITSGVSPYILTVYDPLNNVLGNISTSTNTITVNDLPALSAGFQYRVEVIDACGRAAIIMVTPQLSTIDKTINIVRQCPTGTFPNGSSDIQITVSSNLGEIIPVIVRIDNTNANLGYSIQSGNTFTWYSVGPSTYIIQYDLPGACVNKLYDTVVVTPYEYPTMANSAVYQCSNNNFSVSTEVIGGAGPYQYQIIGSSPTTPSINTDWQNSPVFDISNGANYSLVRMRAIDACGNGSLSDASVLPLENMFINASSNCLNANVTLSATVIANSAYTWYKRVGADSVLVGTGPTYNIPFLTFADTGTYVVKMSVNNGCLTQTTEHLVSGGCVLLPVSKIVLTGRKNGKAADLRFDVEGERNIKEYVVERIDNQGSGYRVIGVLQAKTPAGSNAYSFSDGQPVSGNNNYRIKAVDIDGKHVYSNIVSLNWVSTNVRIYPVPARDVVNLVISNSKSTDLRIQLFTMNGQMLQDKTLQRVQQASVPIYRKNMAAGMYLIRITDLKAGTSQTEKIIFE